MKQLIVMFLFVLFCCSTQVRASLLTLEVTGTLSSIDHSWLIGDIGNVTGTWSFTFDDTGTEYHLYNQGYLGDSNNIYRTFSIYDGNPLFGPTIWSDAIFTGPRLLDLVTIDLSGTYYTAVTFEPVEPYAGSRVTIDDVGISANLIHDNGDSVNFHTNIDSDGVITTNLTVWKWINKYRPSGGIVGSSERLVFSDLTYQIMSTQPIPEPATMLLFGIGLVGLAGISIRRKR